MRERQGAPNIVRLAHFSISLQAASPNGHGKGRPIRECSSRMIGREKKRSSSNGRTSNGGDDATDQERRADFNYKQGRIAKWWTLGTGNSIKADLAFRRETQREPEKREKREKDRKRVPSLFFSCTTRWPAFIRFHSVDLPAVTSHNARLSLLRGPYYFIGSSLSFDPRIRYILLVRAPLSPQRCTLRAAPIRSSIFFLLAISSVLSPRMCTVFCVIKDLPGPPTRPSRCAGSIFDSLAWDVGGARALKIHLHLHPEIRGTDY